MADTGLQAGAEGIDEAAAGGAAAAAGGASGSDAAGGNAGGNKDGAAGAGAGGDKGAAGATGSFAYDKPGLSKHYGLPEKFANAEDPVKAIVEAYTSLEKGMPKAPDTYEIKLADDITKSGFKIEADDPAMKEVLEIGKKHKISGEAMNDLANLHARLMVAINPDRGAEMTKLGANGTQTIGHNVAWLKKVVGDKTVSDKQGSPKLADVLINMPRTADEVLAIAALRQAVGIDKAIPTTQTDGVGKTPLDQLNELKAQLPELTSHSTKANPAKAEQVRKEIADLLNRYPDLKKQRDQQFQSVA